MPFVNGGRFAAVTDTLHQTVENLKHDMTKIGVLVDRLDITIEKLTEVSTNVSHLLTIQGSRLEYQEKNHDRLQLLIEERRRETGDSLEKLEKKIEKVEEEAQAAISDTEETIISKLGSLETLVRDQSTKITKIEQYLWIGMGVIAVILYVLDKINFAAIF